MNELRQAHFKFGNEKGCSEISDYKRNFTEKPAHMERKFNENVRKAHFIFGTDDSRQFYESISSHSYKAPVNVENVQLDEAQKKDLRMHHFSLGREVINDQSNEKQKQQMVSEAGENFTAKPFDEKVFMDRTEQINELRKHNHDFGDHANYYSSMYDQNHNLNLKGYTAQMQGKSKQEIADQIVQLRQTNLSLGNHPTNYHSIQQSDFKENQYSKTKSTDIGLKKTNFILGTDDVVYKSIANEQHGTKPINRHILDVTLLKDLRSAHFKFGNDAACYQSESHNQFQDQNANGAKAATFDIHRYKKPNFEFGFPLKVQEMYTSQYKFDNQELEKGKKDEAWQKSRLSNQDEMKRQKQESNIEFGGMGQDGGKWMSEQQANFVNLGNGHASVMNEQKRKELRKHNAVLGTDEEPWVSENQLTFTDKSKIQIQNRMDDVLKDDLRRNHFVYGNQTNNFDTTSKDIGLRQGPPTKLDPQLAKELRTHHFVYGTDQLEYQSIYSQQFGINKQIPA